MLEVKQRWLEVLQKTAIFSRLTTDQMGVVLSSLFYCVIPADLIQRNTDGAYVLDNLSGVYKVAMSKPKAIITGTLDIFTCNLTLAVNGMGKKLTLLLSSNIDDSIDEEE